MTATVLAWSPGAAGPLLAADPESRWHEAALCAGVDSELWYPATGQRNGPALRICRACPVRAQCLAAALAAGDYHGIQGGMTGDGRAALGVPVTRPLPMLCESGRHLTRKGRRACAGCEKDRRREAAWAREVKGLAA